LLDRGRINAEGIAVKKLGWIGALLVAASCSFPRPADIGPDDASGSSSCQLTAIEPSIANTDDTITIEGTFADAVMVNFGPRRAQPRASAGDRRDRLANTRTKDYGDPCPIFLIDS